MCKDQIENGTRRDRTAHHTLVLIPNCGKLRMRENLNQLEKWADRNLLRFNADKM